MFRHYETLLYEPTARLVREIDDDTGAASISTFNFVVPASGVALGNTVIIMVAAKQVVSTVTDSKGNTYTVDNTNTDGTQVISICSAPVATALVSGDTITVTFAAATARHAALAVEWSGLLGTGYVDQTADNTGSGSALDGGTTGALAQASEVAIAAWCHVGASLTAVGGSATKFTDKVSLGTNPANLGSVWDIRSSAGAVDETATSASASGWAGTTVTYKATISAVEAVDSATVPLRLTPARVQEDSGTEVFTLSPGIALIETGTEVLALAPSAVEVFERGVDTGTERIALTPSASEESPKVDQSTESFKLTPSAVVLEVPYLDSGTKRLALAPSGVDVSPARTFTDAATTTLVMGFTYMEHICLYEPNFEGYAFERWDVQEVGAYQRWNGEAIEHYTGDAIEGGIPNPC